MKSNLNKFRPVLITVLLQLALFLSNDVSIQAAESLGDPFEGNALKNPNWKWSNEPKKWDLGKTKGDWLTIAGENNRNLWGEDTSNRLYQEHSGDFHIETSIIMDYRDGSTVQGIAAMSMGTKDPKGRMPDWVTLKLWGRGAGNANTAVLQYQARERDGEPGLAGVVGAYGEVKQGALPMIMRMQRQKDTFTTWFKLKPGDKWNLVGAHKLKLKDPLQVGIYAGNCDAPGQTKLTSYFEYVKDLDNPFPVEVQNKLTTTWGTLKQSY